MTEHELRYKRHREFMADVMAEVHAARAYRKSPEGKKEYMKNWINDNLGPKGFYTNMSSIKNWKGGVKSE